MRSSNQAKQQQISRQSLSKADYSFASPFFLNLADHAQALYCEEIVRIIPGKRIVAFGSWDEKAIVAKVFFGRQAKQHMERDLKGSQALIKAKVPTPAILYQGKSADPAIFVLVFERILNAQNMDDYWQNYRSLPESETVLRALTLELATQHVLGLAQEDLHLKNFLLTPEKIYTLDGADIRIEKGPLSKKQSLENLALFFSQLGIHTNKLQQRLFYYYIDTRSWLLQKSELRELRKAIGQWNLSRWHAYRKKIFRSCTQFCKLKGVGRFGFYDRQYTSPLFQQLLQDPDPFFKAPDTLILKAGRSSTVVRITLEGRHFVVKRYNLKNIGHRLKRMLQPSRALLSWYLAHQLQFVGIRTAKPVAFIENRFLGLRGKSYFIMEYVDGLRADQFFEKNSIECSQSLIVAKRIIALFFNLARLRLSHGDLKITNLLLNHQQEPLLIDLDSMQEHRSSLGLWHRFRKDIQRFLENWQSQPAWQQLFQKLIRDMSTKTSSSEH